MSTAKKRREALPPSEEKLLVVSEVELVYKSKVSPSKMPVVNSAKDAFLILKEAWNPNTIELREEFKILLLNHGNKVLGIYHAFAGNSKSVEVDIRLIFTAAMKANATSIVIAHNHPSGVLRPSSADKILTGKVKLVADLMGIVVLDHLIVSHEHFYSMADNRQIN